LLRDGYNVVTTKDLTAEDRARLGGAVDDILVKKTYSRDQLLEHVRDAVITAHNKA
jgi:hypothetical protein